MSTNAQQIIALAARRITLDAEWNEAQHKRDHGKFSSGGRSAKGKLPAVGNRKHVANEAGDYTPPKVTNNYVGGTVAAHNAEFDKLNKTINSKYAAIKHLKEGSAERQQAVKRITDWVRPRLAVFENADDRRSGY